MKISLLDLLKEYRENQINDVGYDVAIKLAEMEYYLTDEERKNKIEKFKYERNLSLKKIEIVDNFNFDKIFTDKQVEILRYYFIDGLNIRDKENRSKYNQRLYRAKKKAEKINVVI